MPTGPDQQEVINDFARLWRDADKVVYSSTLAEASTPRTHIEPRFDPAAVRDLADSSDRPVGVGGPTLAAQALRSGVVDEVQLFLVPVSVGGGTPAFSRDSFLALELLDERRFENGTVYLNYSVTGAR
jgi:dihydrofolate reductase